MTPIVEEMFMVFPVATTCSDSCLCQQYELYNSMFNAKWYLLALCSIGHLIPAAFRLSSLLAVHTFSSSCIFIHAHLNSKSLKMEEGLYKNTIKACF